jgi:WXG100 family type VII secretion target
MTRKGNTVTEIYVNYAGVENVEELLQQANQAIVALLENVQGTVSKLQPYWAGPSNDEYQIRQAKWTADMADMQQILVRYNSTLSDLKYNYFTTDRNLAIQWSQL